MFPSRGGGQLEDSLYPIRGQPPGPVCNLNSQVSHHSQQKSKKCGTWCNLKNDRMIFVRFQGKPFNVMVIQAYAPTSNTEEAEVEWFYEDL